MMQQSVWLPDEAATLAFGASLAGSLHAPLVIYLNGSLGAGKTTFARGHLYRRGSDRPRAAEALRSGTALRLGIALGLAPGTLRRDVIAAVAQASGVDPVMVDSLLYGPPPTNDKALATLAVQLDQLESEVHSA